jgi:hypothetical protein
MFNTMPCILLVFRTGSVKTADPFSPFVFFKPAFIREQLFQEVLCGPAHTRF